MNDFLTSDDPRYKELFDITKEVAGGEIYGDLTPKMNALRDQAPVMKGTLRELLGVPAVHMAYDRPREHYTLFTINSVIGRSARVYCSPPRCITRAPGLKTWVM